MSRPKTSARRLVNYFNCATGLHRKFEDAEISFLSDFFKKDYSLYEFKKIIDSRWIYIRKIKKLPPREDGYYDEFELKAFFNEDFIADVEKFIDSTACRVLKFLNECRKDTRFRQLKRTKLHLKPISARLADGFTYHELKRVCKYFLEQCKLEDKKFNFTPKFLFNKQFPNRLNQANEYYGIE